jgi:hypothetical protein
LSGTFKWVPLEWVFKWRPVHLICSEKELRINADLILHFFLLHLLMQTVFHLNDPWAREVTGLLTEIWDPF